MLRDEQETEATEQAVNHGRRSAMKKITLGVGVLAGYSLLPETWTRPIIGQIVLPAHAATSGSSLHDPCAVEVRGGDHTTANVIIKVTGFVTPPVANLPVVITATPVLSGVKKTDVKANTTTSANGTFEAIMTIGGGPGITSINVTTNVTGADGAANCVVHTTSGSTPATTTSYYYGTYNSVYDGESWPSAICFTISGSSLSFITYEVEHPGDTNAGTGTYPNASGTGGYEVGYSTVNVHIDGIAGNTLSYTLTGTIPGSPPQTMGPLSGTAEKTTNPCNAR